MALSLGAEGLDYLRPNQWQGDVSYRWLHSDRFFNGTEEVKALRNIVVADIHSWDVTANYGISPRFSLSLTLPFLYGAHTSAFEHDGVHRHTMSAGGLGDLRFVGNAWLFDPTTHAQGNIAVSAGFKAPTGEYDATDIAYRATGPVERPVDVAIQPGDGGWGLVLETQAYQRLYANLYAYLAGFYLINPRNVNNVETTTSTPGNVTVNSVPDQYLGRVGLSYVIWPKQGLSLSVGGRIDGIPVEDAAGGSDGFRRAGYGIYIEPGITWARGKNAASVFVPVAVERNEQHSLLDQSLGQPSIGGFSDFFVVVSYSRRF